MYKRIICFCCMLVVLVHLPVMAATDWPQYFAEVLEPQMGGASPEPAYHTVSYTQIADTVYWDQRYGILGAEIVDFNEDGQEELLLFYLDRIENEQDYLYFGNSKILNTPVGIYARLYMKDSLQNVAVSQPLLLTTCTGMDFEVTKAGIMYLQGTPYLYTESFYGAYLAAGNAYHYTWYLFDGSSFVPAYKIDRPGSSDSEELSLINYTVSEEGNELLLWADAYLREVYLQNAAILMGIDASLAEVVATGINIIGGAVSPDSLNTDPDIRAEYGGFKEIPTCWGTDYMKESVKYVTAGTINQGGRDMTVQYDVLTELKPSSASIVQAAAPASPEASYSPSAYLPDPYEEFIRNQGYIREDSATEFLEQEVIGMFLYDLDRDQSPELFVYCGSMTRGGTLWDVYSCLAGEVVFLGKAAGVVQGEDPAGIYPGLFFDEGGAGYGGYRYVEILGNSINQMILTERDLYGNEKQVTTNEGLYEALQRVLQTYSEYDRYDGVIEVHTYSEIMNMGWAGFKALYGF